jgi:hypothetical protein
MTWFRLFSTMLSISILTLLAGCGDDPPKINYEMGFFPDSVIAIEGLNSVYDDYNVDLEAAVISSWRSLVFSSNRHSSGGEFNIIYGFMWYNFGQTTGIFQLGGEIASDPFLSQLTSQFNTAGNEFGPFRFFNPYDGLEYMVAASQTSASGLDILFTSYIPPFNNVPFIPDPVPATLFNSGYNDAYISLNDALDTAWFSSDRGGDYDIYMLARPAGSSVDDWFLSEAVIASTVDSVCSASDDKTPFVSGNYMVFASDMPGGSGGFDIYLSVFRNGKWSSPVNMGPKINTPYNEYRPVIGTDNFFSNSFLIFSSDREGGKGGYDLYFTGLDFK